MKGLETPLTEYKLNYIYLNLDYINYLSTLLENIEKLNHYFIWLSVCSLPEVHVECVVHELDVDVLHGENIERHLLVRSMTHLILHAFWLSPSPWHTQGCLHSLAELSCHSQPGPSRDERYEGGIYRVFQIYHLKILQQCGNVQQIFSGGVLGRGGGQGQQEDEGCWWCHGAECAHAAGSSLSMEPLLTKQGLDNHSSAARYNWIITTNNCRTDSQSNFAPATAPTTVEGGVTAGVVRPRQIVIYFIPSLMMYQFIWHTQP